MGNPLRKVFLLQNDEEIERRTAARLPLQQTLKDAFRRIIPQSHAILRMIRNESIWCHQSRGCQGGGDSLNLTSSKQCRVNLQPGYRYSLLVVHKEIKLKCCLLPPVNQSECVKTTIHLVENCYYHATLLMASDLGITP